MGKGMRAGRIPKAEKDMRKLERAVDEYAQRVEKRIVRNAKDSIADDIIEELTYRHNIDMIAVMLALRDEFGFGRSRLIRTMKKTMDHAERMLEDHADVDEMLEVIRSETGLREDELIWDVEVEKP